MSDPDAGTRWVEIVGLIGVGSLLKTAFDFFLERRDRRQEQVRAACADLLAAAELVALNAHAEEPPPFVSLDQAPGAEGGAL